MKYSKLLAAMMLAMALTACGGGGGNFEPTPEEQARIEAESKMLADVEAIRARIEACKCATEDPIATRPDVVSDADLQILMRYAQYLMGGNQQEALALLSRVNAAIEYRKKQTTATAQPTTQFVVAQ